MHTSIEDVVLTDGSKVYDVVAYADDGNLIVTFKCVDKRHAIQLTTELEKCVNIEIE